MNHQLEKLQWLMRLRWLALIGLSIAATLAYIGIVPGLNLPLIALAVQFGVGSNFYISYLLMLRKIPNQIHIWQALLDTVVLTIVIWASGGIACPFTAFYVFPVLLAVLLVGQNAFWPTLIASMLGLCWQLIVIQMPILQFGMWNPIQPWDKIFHFLAIAFTIGMVAYFCARFSETIKQQKQAIKASDELLRLAFESLNAGVELIENGVVIWQNPYAQQSLGKRVDDRWHCPNHDKHCDGLDCGSQRKDGQNKCLFEIGEHSNKRIYEILLLSPTGQKQLLALYIDRTSEIAYQQKLIHTERLASLGRTVQGVAHELNTPLATIQILGKDLLDAFKNLQIRSESLDDINESANIIVEEVQRCRRITHALLGKNEYTQQGNLKNIINRSVALVYPNQKHLVDISFHQLEELQYPIDPLVQIFVNLLQNAKDVSLDQKVEIELNQHDHMVHISLRDYGTGISETAQKYLFEPFFTTKSNTQGTGLGLYTSYTLAKGLGGDLSLSNHAEIGVVALLKLPMKSI
jgi:nitrogen fixation/metabolism regulation signal transduction histidine kinase